VSQRLRDAGLLLACLGMWLVIKVSYLPGLASAGTRTVPTR
jgi:hypothetical protein